MIVNITRDLPASRTHKRRYYQLVAPAGEWRYRVMIVQGKNTDVYFLDEFHDADLRPGCRSVWFSRQTGEETAERPSLYRVVIDENGIPVHCNCRGSVCHRQGVADRPADPAEVQDGSLSCKHKDVIRDMVETGLLVPLAAEVIA